MQEISATRNDRQSICGRQRAFSSGETLTATEPSRRTPRWPTIVFGSIPNPEGGTNFVANVPQPRPPQLETAQQHPFECRQFANTEKLC
jgi:hypothetical protein